MKAGSYSSDRDFNLWGWDPIGKDIFLILNKMYKNANNLGLAILTPLDKGVSGHLTKKVFWWEDHGLFRFT